MSIKREEEIGCPRCGGTQTVTLWDSIDADPDPGARAALLEAKINRFDCQSCDFDALVPVPLLYHDRRRQFVVQYFPFGWLDEKEFVARFTSDGRDRQVLEAFEKAVAAKKLPPGAEPAEPHLVFDMAELVRFILFRERVFDFRAGADSPTVGPRESPERQ
ncbi:MAG TPA: CpXC domain-containing protein [Candidatus Methanoperedens sp.]|nr:CpXC domain-containing protein [Candidatus Methanoperedens sp.]